MILKDYSSPSFFINKSPETARKKEMRCRNGANGQGNINLQPHTEEELEKSPFLTDVSVYRLKLELVDHFLYGGSEDLGMEEDDAWSIKRSGMMRICLTRMRGL